MNCIGSLVEPFQNWFSWALEAYCLSIHVLHPACVMGDAWQKCAAVPRARELQVQVSVCASHWGLANLHLNADMHLNMFEGQTLLFGCTVQTVQTVQIISYVSFFSSVDWITSGKNKYVHLETDNEVRQAKDGGHTFAKTSDLKTNLAFSQHSAVLWCVKLRLKSTHDSDCGQIKNYKSKLASGDSDMFLVCCIESDFWWFLCFFCQL